MLIVALAMGFSLQACAAGVYDNHDRECNFCEHWREQAMARSIVQDRGDTGAHGNIGRERSV
ncbi:MAG: hypothetical protein ACE144_01665 [Thermodesulfobacteriota bacterium]